jgi:hypothetical protein
MSRGTQIEIDSTRALRALAEYRENDDDPNAGRYELSGPELEEQSGVPTLRLNDAVEFLDSNGYVDVIRTFGTAPYTFTSAALNPLGRHEAQRIEAASASPETAPAPVGPIRSQPFPIGSPYGFTDGDWEFVESKRRRHDVVKVVVGYGFRSRIYDPAQLIANLKTLFERAVGDYNQEGGHSPVGLDFTALRAGYGEHLFNEIARDIIAADIAVFETSEFNPNVMIEMGVALTWGTRILPIKAEGRRKPPSDISGQTWADYRNSAAVFVEQDHLAMVVRMIDRALRRRTAG